MTDPRPHARADVVSRPLGDDEWALFDPTTERVHALNLAAAVLWEHLDGQHGQADLVRVLGEHFVGVDPAALIVDVRAALDRFEAEGLLTWD